MPRVAERTVPEYEEAGPLPRHSWWRRGNRLGVRNGEAVVIWAVALAMGLVVTVVTALLGVH